MAEEIITSEIKQEPGREPKSVKGSIQRFINDAWLKISLWVLVGLVLALLVFKIGVMVGYRKAGFAYRWGDNYHRNFGGPVRGFAGDFWSDRMFMEANGVFGLILKVRENQLVARGKDDIERVILVSNSTVIMRLRDRLKLSDLKPDDYFVAIGESNENGQLEAKLIRVLPPGPAASGKITPSAFLRP